LAIDLGCGHGLQSISLANLGFCVKAVDFNTQLLHHLAEARKERSV
jgi:2-polyprenyl-3-methyl-5-hydroxy-6-metoxy-1,4-benzoquinol methylase